MLISITGGKDLTLYEVDQTATLSARSMLAPTSSSARPSTKNLDGIIRVSVVATGVDIKATDNVRPAVSFTSQGNWRS